MAKKKDFKNIVKEEINDIGAITRNMFSNDTIQKAETKKEEQIESKADLKEKRKYTRLTSKENKTKTISLRLTEREYNELIRKADKNNSGTITNYIMQLIRGGK